MRFSSKTHLIAAIFHRHDTLPEKRTAHRIVVPSIDFGAAGKHGLARRILRMHGEARNSACPVHRVLRYHLSFVSAKLRTHASRVCGVHGDIPSSDHAPLHLPSIKSKTSASSFLSSSVLSTIRSVSPWAQRFVLLMTSNFQVEGARHPPRGMLTRTSIVHCLFLLAKAA